MVAKHIVVDGSNVATEGRSVPSLSQLEEAVSELRREFPGSVLTVVVDATFAHRIEPSELERFQEGVLEGRYVSPPAGAVGRGDAFLLRIAEKVDATVVSNDSFQEFHGEHAWLFDRGRLIGATPVAGIGWILMARTPVRGARSKNSVERARRPNAKVRQAIKEATREAVEAPTKTVAVQSTTLKPQLHPGRQAVNDPITFITFIAEHRLGDVIEAEVESFTSHGAVVTFEGVRCYVPLSGLGDPAPKSARGVLHRGEVRPFVITALDPHRRGVELAFPEVAIVSGRPSEETVKAEVAMAKRPRKAPAASKKSASPTKRAPSKMSRIAQGVDPSSDRSSAKGPGSDETRVVEKDLDHRVAPKPRKPRSNPDKSTSRGPSPELRAIEVGQPPRRARRTTRQKDPAPETT